MNLEVITVGNGTKEYPGNFTKKENNRIRRHCRGKILHLFSGKSKIGDVLIDYRYGIDVFEYLKNPRYYGTVIIDDPYNQRYADKYQKLGNTPEQFIIFAQGEKTTELFDRVREINPKIIIMKSWNYYIVEGYRLKKGYLCYAGGYRKSTLLLIMKRINTIS